MNESERKVADTAGQIMLAEKGQRPLPDAEWEKGRILLSNKRLILATPRGKRSFRVDDVEQIGGRIDTSIDARRVAEYVTIEFPDHTYLVAAENHERFERSLFRTLLHGQSLLVKHPAVEGGVVTDAEWERATLTLDDDGIAVGLKAGHLIDLVLEEMSRLRTDRRPIQEAERLVLGVAHVDSDGTIVETHLAARDPTGEHLHTYIERGMSVTETNVDLTEYERAVLMALYSGISPFEIPSFLDLDVDRIEAIFAHLLELDVVDEIRRRREVRLNARGRNLADGVSENQ